MSSVVIEELLAGARTRRHQEQAEELFAPFERARRIVTPTHAVWKEAGDVMSKLLRATQRHASSSGQGLLNDVLIALGARFLGATVVTANREAFRQTLRWRTFRLELL